MTHRMKYEDQTLTQIADELDEVMRTRARWSDGDVTMCIILTDEHARQISARLRCIDETNTAYRAFLELQHRTTELEEAE